MIMKQFADKMVVPLVPLGSSHVFFSICSFCSASPPIWGITTTGTFGMLVSSCSSWPPLSPPFLGSSPLTAWRTGSGSSLHKVSLTKSGSKGSNKSHPVYFQVHVGYDFPFALHRFFWFYSGAPAHDMHHLRPLTCFQPWFNYLDRLMGYHITYEDLKKMTASKLKKFGVYSADDEKGLIKIN